MSPKPHIKRLLCERLEEIKVKGPCVLLGDFNCVLQAEERNTGNVVSCNFANWVERNGLINLRFIGNQFTWNHNAHVDTRRSARLDRGLCNDEWRRLFSSVVIIHLKHMLTRITARY